jgi:hypothetical protein
MPRRPIEPKWEATLSPKDGNVVEGDIREIGVVHVVRLDHPDSEPVKVATRQVRAMTGWGLARKADRVANDLIDRDRRRLASEIQAKIDRLTAQLTSG